MSASVVIRESSVMARNSLRGFATVEFPSGMVVHDVSIHECDGNRWASPPSKHSLSRDGVHICDTSGKGQHTPLVSFSSKDQRDRFSAMVIAPLRAQSPEVFQQSRGAA